MRPPANPQRPFARRACLLTVLLALLALPSGARAGGAHLTIHPRVNYGDTVGIVVEVGAGRHERCGARVRKGGREEEAPSVSTGAEGGAKWSWLVPANIGAGEWHFKVTCGRSGHHETRSRAFTAGAGFGHKSRSLWVERSMHVEAFRRPGKAGGNGGGGALYPIGQCTWWVARRRPDLPYFPGRSGDAMHWAESAEAAGFPTGAIPVPGAVAVFAPDQYGAGLYGHVAYVLSVNGKEMTISEDNFEGHHRPDKRTIEWAGLRFIYRKDQATGPPLNGGVLPQVKPTVELRGLTEDTPVSGQIPLSVVSNAAGVRFSVRYFTDLANPESAQTVTMGEDRTSADGFTMTWDTTAVPNQGGPGGSTVVVTATALGSGGEALEATSSVRVNVANSRTENGVTYWPYYVVGLREEGEPELHLRSGPGYSEYAETGKRYDGEEVDVVCQEVGEPYVSPRTHEETKIWDRLVDGSWVIDYYVDTPNRGRFSAPLSRCS